MKIGIDLHGVITDDPHFWQHFSSKMRRAGHTVCVISGPSARTVWDELGSLYSYDCAADIFNQVYSVVDWLKNNDFKMWEDPDKPDHWWTDEKDWNAAKGRMCEQYGIDIIFDNSPEYEEYMPDTTKFVLIKN